MEDMLSPAQFEVLELFARSKTMLAFDYDGTLAPIVTDPAQAFMRSETRELLAELARRYTVVIFSGRAQADALRRMRGVGVCEVVGNHGIEPRGASDRYIALVRQWLPALQLELAHLDGVVIEDKIYSLAVHYRQAASQELARTTILHAASALGSARIVGGKKVINLMPKGAPDKGIAVERERQRLGCDTAIYVGDDETDEDVFRLAHPQQLLAIRVGAEGESAARYYIADQHAIDALLQALLDLRARSDADPRLRGAADR